MEGDRIVKALKAKRPMTRLDWARDRVNEPSRSGEQAYRCGISYCYV